MSIALTAPTGRVGTGFLAAARQQHIPIRALDPDVERLPIRGTAVRFDFADPATFAPAFDGIRTLVLVAPGARWQAERVIAAVDAARTAGVAHIVRLSADGADDPATRFAAQHHEIEQHIRASRLAWTFVRATFFMENLFALAAPIATGTYPAPLGEARFTQVATADIAATLFAIAAAPDQHRGATYTVTGPTADGGVDIARALSAAAGHEVRFVDIPEAALRQNLLRAGLDDWSAEGIIEGYRKIRAGLAATVTDDVLRVTGHAPVDFVTWARDHADAFRRK